MEGVVPNDGHLLREKEKLIYVESKRKDANRTSITQGRSGKKSADQRGSFDQERQVVLIKKDNYQGYCGN